MGIYTEQPRLRTLARAKNTSVWSMHVPEQYCISLRPANGKSRANSIVEAI